jgi:S1-C subfamily serine protease
MIGNNDAQEYSVKYGRVTNLVLDRGQRHSATLQTSFDRAGGSSGSPVFNAKGEVVAIHFAGTESTSFELRIEYLKDALEQLRAGRGVRRGDIGASLALVLVSDAQKHFHLPDALAQSVKSVRSDLKRMIIVHSGCRASPHMARCFRRI